MFLNAPENPTKLKRAVYLTAATILGILLSIIARVMIEAGYMRWVEGAGQTIVFYGDSALPPVLRVGLTVLGAIGGFSLGRYWWRKVYIERIWAKARR